MNDEQMNKKIERKYYRAFVKGIKHCLINSQF